MKIVHVIPALTKGGGERVAVELANFAADSGNQVTILAAFPVAPSLLQHLIHPQIEIKFVSKNGRASYLQMLWWIARNLQWLSSFDILHCHLTYGAFFASLTRILRRIRFIKKPCIVETYHAVGMPISSLHRKIHSQLARQRDALVLMAKDEYWQQFILNNKNLLTRIIPNGINYPPQIFDFDSRRRYRKQLGIPEECDVVIGTIGMLRPDRQPTRYIPIFAEVAKVMGHKVHFIIAGDGPEKTKLQDAIAKYKLNNQVHLAGLVTNTSLTFSVMDIYISLAVGSITGISMLEAAFSKVPVVGIQLIDNYKTSADDWVWSSTSDGAIADELIRLSVSSGERSLLAEKQHSYVQKHHTTTAMGTAYLELYEQVLKQKKN